LLRQLRADAELTQQELAKAAGLSPRAVSDLERGINRTARKDSAVRLAGALGLAEPVRSLFVAAACGRILAAQVLAAKPGQAPGGTLGSGRGCAWLRARADELCGPGRGGARGRGLAGR
jgi:transcriptional regulator with XRE-family HTH domain